MSQDRSSTPMDSEYERLERLKVEADRWVAALSNCNAGKPSPELVASAVRGLRDLLERATRSESGLSPFSRKVLATDALSAIKNVPDSGGVRG